jgi:hypothetical protein
MTADQFLILISLAFAVAAIIWLTPTRAPRHEDFEKTKGNAADAGAGGFDVGGD